MNNLPAVSWRVQINDKAHIIKIYQLADDTMLFVSSKTDIALAMQIKVQIKDILDGLL
jgi:hypothetical protein